LAFLGVVPSTRTSPTKPPSAPSPCILPYETLLPKRQIPESAPQKHPSSLKKQKKKQKPKTPNKTKKKKKKKKKQQKKGWGCFGGFFCFFFLSLPQRAPPGILASFILSRPKARLSHLLPLLSIYQTLPVPSILPKTWENTRLLAFSPKPHFYVSGIDAEIALASHLFFYPPSITWLLVSQAHRVFLSTRAIFSAFHPFLPKNFV